MESSTQGEDTSGSDDGLMEGALSAEDNEAVKEAVECCPNSCGQCKNTAARSVKIQNDLKGKFQKMQTAKTKPVKVLWMLNKRHLQSKRANMFKTRRQWTSSIGHEEGME